MKKALLGAFLLSAGALSAQAQISAGTKLLTGSIGYSQQKQETSSPIIRGQRLDVKYKQFNFNPSGGYFVADNLALGITGGLYLAASQNYNYALSLGQVQKEERKTRALSGGIFGRYYKFLGDKFALYGQLGGGYQNVYNSNSPDVAAPYPITSRQWGLYANLLPGIVFFPVDKLGLELALRGVRYGHVKTAYGQNGLRTTDSSFNFGFGLNDLNLGISLYLGRN
ncbi:hypothetical protein D0N36_11885 [Hymenobacter lapidiphilus]|uniref:outer membrane beta-barrel protein n=1 Tax=Hymenobacter sp. CCM 8763 TaxID=2303334 RepID=UPI000E343F72|nr:outer membrane beta-barrel protein [Hymenobacter sp. CCM 8763]RFP64872.1 hypothetical protein D0N36_11885 [Hymenobacter sp. CCM 8763]